MIRNGNRIIGLEKGVRRSNDGKNIMGNTSVVCLRLMRCQIEALSNNISPPWCLAFVVHHPPQLNTLFIFVNITKYASTVPSEFLNSPLFTVNLISDLFRYYANVWSTSLNRERDIQERFFNIKKLKIIIWIRKNAICHACFQSFIVGESKPIRKKGTILIPWTIRFFLSVNMQFRKKSVVTTVCLIASVQVRYRSMEAISPYGTTSFAIGPMSCAPKTPWYGSMQIFAWTTLGCRIICCAFSLTRWICITWMRNWSRQRSTFWNTSSAPDNLSTSFNEVVPLNRVYRRPIIKEKTMTYGKHLFGEWRSFLF